MQNVWKLSIKVDTFFSRETILKMIKSSLAYWNRKEGQKKEKRKKSVWRVYIIQANIILKWKTVLGNIIFMNLLINIFNKCTNVRMVVISKDSGQNLK